MVTSRGTCHAPLALAGATACARGTKHLSTLYLFGTFLTEQLYYKIAAILISFVTVRVTWATLASAPVKILLVFCGKRASYLHASSVVCWSWSRLTNTFPVEGPARCGALVDVVVVEKTTTFATACCAAGATPVAHSSLQRAIPGHPPLRPARGRRGTASKSCGTGFTL